MKYNSKWRSKETGHIYELGMHYVQNDVTYYFLNMGSYSKFLSEEVITMYFEPVQEAKSTIQISLEVPKTHDKEGFETLVFRNINCD